MLTLGKLSSFFRLLQGEIARASGNYTELRSSVEYFQPGRAGAAPLAAFEFSVRDG
jgi:hypothetical protein